MGVPDDRELARAQLVRLARALLIHFPHHGQAILEQLPDGRMTLDRWNRAAAGFAALSCIPGEHLSDDARRVRMLVMSCAENLALVAALTYWRSPALDIYLEAAASLVL